MKNMFLVLVFTVLGTVLFAQKSYGDFVVTNDDVQYFRNIRHGLTSFLVCKKANGDVVKFSKFEVEVYAKDGKRFEKMPVYKNNKLTNNYAFMRAITYKNGMKLFEHNVSSSFGEQISKYFVFKADKLVVNVNEKNYESIKQFYAGK